ncbi:MAG: hypothetical protein ABSG15_15305 [FCB group bacterium]|jgi:hypothetical protein
MNIYSTLTIIAAVISIFAAGYSIYSTIKESRTHSFSTEIVQFDLASKEMNFYKPREELMIVLSYDSYKLFNSFKKGFSKILAEEINN